MGATNCRLCGARKEQEEEELDYEQLSIRATYEAVTKGHLREIGALFSAMDKDGSGKLDVRELRGAVTRFMGIRPRELDVNSLLLAFDTHGHADGEIDFDEFRWYLADWALTMRENWDPDHPKAGELEGATAVLPEVISDFEAIVNN